MVKTFCWMSARVKLFKWISMRCLIRVVVLKLLKLCDSASLKTLLMHLELLGSFPLLPFCLSLTIRRVFLIVSFRVEGVFRKNCEITLRVLENNCDMLSNVLETFIYDPLVDWTRDKRVSAQPESIQLECRKKMDVVRARLSGIIVCRIVLLSLLSWRLPLVGVCLYKSCSVQVPFDRPLEILKLSIPGHVEYLIAESTSAKLLAQMFVGMDTSFFFSPFESILELDLFCLDVSGWMPWLWRTAAVFFFILLYLFSRGSNWRHWG